MTHARLRKLSAVVGWALYVAAGIGLWLRWGLAVWLLTGAGMLAIQWSSGFGRRESSRTTGVEGDDIERETGVVTAAEKVLRWYPKWW
ncbi:hypothetical protein [Micromonospora echinofusca]|uniref:hypothetical protein n=1 Tax=Micromonospora echinofusca TaxID=47858 RepID=UPI0033FD271C